MKRQIKILSLNTWGGRLDQKLFEFLKNNQNVDVFCLQEVYNNATEPVVEDMGDKLKLLSDIKELLPHHYFYFVPDSFIQNYFGNVIFYKNTITINNHGNFQIHKSKNKTNKKDRSRVLQFLEMDLEDTKLTIANTHCLWNEEGKMDNDDRIKQSKIISNFLNTIKTPVVLCGDFNLLPDTESIKIIENAGVKNLIKEYNIKSTRTSFYKKPDKFADYIFVSQDIKIESFKLLPDEISDHAVLELVINL